MVEILRSDKIRKRDLARGNYTVAPIKYLRQAFARMCGKFVVYPKYYIPTNRANTTVNSKGEAKLYLRKIVIRVREGENKITYSRTISR